MEDFDYAENLAERQKSVVVGITPDHLQQNRDKIIKNMSHLEKQIKKVSMDIVKHRDDKRRLSIF